MYNRTPKYNENILERQAKSKGILTEKMFLNFGETSEKNTVISGFFQLLNI